MKNYTLSFGEITILESNLAEVVVNEGVVMNEQKVEEYHSFLLNHLEAPFKLLVNTKNSYSYSFNAQKTIGNLKEIQAIAVVVYSIRSLMSIQTLMDIGIRNTKTINVFQDRDEAINWLYSLNGSQTL
ncbi:hypothetical protein [Aestuariibaculum sediminum]|uniref:STAS/SEC14 domain-containing protein n=1 Tax=Aestuariibaculum sediminum TaxID=2770637 RepID=A0A8J6QEX3_9FLAO|nr:hypothetical protein [Aestuariibaculum sediminum]MBD0830649.1 hypothetical protein [Aestuariibaculum sediminum]